jgi:hypothetical protein
MKEVLKFNFVTETQIRIIDALSPAWKVMLMNKLYQHCGMESNETKDFIYPEKWNGL